jgi:penicillin amidase
MLPGETDEFDWKGIIPFNELPNTYNPVSNEVSSANNKTVDNDYPYHIGTWYSLPYRIDRIREMLNTKDQLDVTDFKQIQTDNKSILANELLNITIPIIENSSTLNSLDKIYLDTLKNWDFTMSRKSMAAYFFDLYYLGLIKNIFSDQLGNVLYNKFMVVSQIPRSALYNVLRNDSSGWWDDATTIGIVESKQDIIINTFLEIATKLRQESDSNQLVLWGNKHQLTLQHPLGQVNLLNRVFNFNRGPYPVGGSFHTIAPFGYDFTNPFTVNHGASHRNIYDLSDWDHSISVIPTGNSGIPVSPWYCNQTRLYIANRYHYDYFSKYMVEKHAYREMLFIPVTQ